MNVMIQPRFLFLLFAAIIVAYGVSFFSSSPTGLASNGAADKSIPTSEDKETFCKGQPGKHVKRPALLSYFLLGQGETEKKAWAGYLTSRSEEDPLQVSRLAQATIVASEITAQPLAGQIVDVDTGLDGDRSFSPSLVVINTGDTVRWNFKSSGHNVVSGNNCVNDNQFCSPSDANCSSNPTGLAGTSYSHTFNSPGTFNYFCRPHCSEGMTGTVIVQAGGTPTPTPTPSPSVTPTPTPTPTPKTIQFSSSSYSVNESDAVATITVNRTGDLSGTASVAYSTSDIAGSQSCSVLNGYASARCDYISSFGTLSFAAGESAKTFTVHIIDDSYAEGNEFLYLNLGNPLGATLGSPSTALLTIADNETTNGVNPVDNAGFFVREQYLDFLNREPDSGGFNFWTNEINSCGATQSCIDIKRINVSAAFFLSIEFQQTGYLVERIYKSAYGDGNGTSTFNGAHQLPVPIVGFNEFLSDTQEIGQGVVVGQGNWQDVLEANKQAFTSEFVQRTRFSTAFPTTMSPQQFVDALFANAGITPSSADRNTAIAEFGSDTNTSNLAARGKALRDVAENSTLNTQEFNRAFVLMQFFGYLRRDPNSSPDTDYSGFDFWLTKLNQFNGNFVNAEMVKAFINSDEYRKRFGP